MKWIIEVVQVPVSDVERAKEFYADQLGFVVDFDMTMGEGVRFVQLTPPGSGCSIQVSSGMYPDLVPGSLRGMVLVVPDIRAAYAELQARGVESSGVVVVGGPEGQRPAVEGEELDNVGFVHVTDPDGNQWGIQQISARGA